MRALLICILIAGCSSPASIGEPPEMRALDDSPQLNLTTDRTTYVIGSGGTLVLVNGRDNRVGPYSALRCLKAERLADDVWVNEDYNVVCASPGGPGYAPGTSESQFHVMPDRFSAGNQYRFTVTLVDEVTKEQFVVVSNAFVVE